MAKVVPVGVVKEAVKIARPVYLVSSPYHARLSFAGTMISVRTEESLSSGTRIAASGMPPS